MTPIPFVQLDDPRYGSSVPLSPLVRRVVANNPSKFTYLGTGTYIVGQGDVAVIDPGPRLDTHRQALLDALHGEQVVAVLVTHCHADHSPLATWLGDQFDAPTVGIGPHRSLGELWPNEAWPRFPVPDEAPTTDADVTIEESVDTAFCPEVAVTDGEVAARGAGWTLTTVATPGHASNHACYALAEERALFTGDHVMGWSTTVISPPDGDMKAYLASLDAVRGRGDAVLYPTHGAPVTEPGPFLDAYRAHRLEREAQVLAAIRGGLSTLAEIVPVLYADVRPALHAPAARSVMAHVLKLIDDGAVRVGGDAPAHPLAHFAPAP